MKKILVFSFLLWISACGPSSNSIKQVTIFVNFYPYENLAQKWEISKAVGILSSSTYGVSAADILALEIGFKNDTNKKDYFSNLRDSLKEMTGNSNIAKLFSVKLNEKLPFNYLQERWLGETPNGIKSLSNKLAEIVKSINNSVVNNSSEIPNPADFNISSVETLGLLVNKVKVIVNYPAVLSDKSIDLKDRNNLANLRNTVIISAEKIDVAEAEYVKYLYLYTSTINSNQRELISDSLSSLIANNSSDIATAAYFTVEECINSDCSSEFERDYLLYVNMKIMSGASSNLAQASEDLLVQQIANGYKPVTQDDPVLQRFITNVVSYIIANPQSVYSQGNVANSLRHRSENILDKIGLTIGAVAVAAWTGAVDFTIILPAAAGMIIGGAVGGVGVSRQEIRNSPPVEFDQDDVREFARITALGIESAGTITFTKTSLQKLTMSFEGISAGAGINIFSCEALAVATAYLVATDIISVGFIVSVKMPVAGNYVLSVYKSPKTPFITVDINSCIQTVITSFINIDKKIITSGATIPAPPGAVLATNPASVFILAKIWSDTILAQLKTML